MHRIVIHETTYVAIEAQRLPGSEFRSSAAPVPREAGWVTIELSADLLERVSAEPNLPADAFLRRLSGPPPLEA